MLGLRSAPKGAVETLGVPLASLAAGCYNCPCTSSGCLGTPTLVHRQEPPGLGHTRCRALLGQALTVHGHAWPGLCCSLTPCSSRPPQVARAYRGVVGGRGMRDVGGARGAEARRHASRRARLLYLERRNVR